jgi:hypothetical protein
MPWLLRSKPTLSETARKFFKRGLKSSNKSYYGFGKVADKLIDAQAPPLRQTQQVRNFNAPLAGELLAITRGEYKGRTPFEIGQERYNAGITAGNCGEMACVALYIAINTYAVDKEEVVLQLVEYKHTHGVPLFRTEDYFAHQFVALGMRLPTPPEQVEWAEKRKELKKKLELPTPPKTSGWLSEQAVLSAELMKKQRNREHDNAWAVDPWAGVCCRLGEYGTKIAQQMADWVRTERISAQRFVPIWMRPDDPMILGLFGPAGEWRQGNI